MLLKTIYFKRELIIQLLFYYSMDKIYWTI